MMEIASGHNSIRFREDLITKCVSRNRFNGNSLFLYQQQNRDQIVPIVIPTD